jgi:hypothetical protein
LSKAAYLLQNERQWRPIEHGSATLAAIWGWMQLDSIGYLGAAPLGAEKMGDYFNGHLRLN